MVRGEVRVLHLLIIIILARASARTVDVHPHWLIVVFRDHAGPTSFYSLTIHNEP